MKSVRPRHLALSALNSLEDSSRFPKHFLESAFQRASHLNKRDRAFAVHLVQGVLRWRLRLDWMVQQTVRFPFREIEPHVLNILRIALYQIFFMDRVPESAAVNERLHQLDLMPVAPRSVPVAADHRSDLSQVRRRKLASLHHHEVCIAWSHALQ